MTHFHFLSGGGNDFIALVEPSDSPSPQRIRDWTQRGLSLGADGLFALSRQEDGVRMEYYNADGGRAELCLNGTRCAAALAFELGWADEEVEIHTDAGAVQASRASEGRVRLSVPPAEQPRPVAPEIAGTRHEGWFLEVGVPHFVLFTEDAMASIPVVELGRRLRRHEAFAPAGVNVDFVRLPGPGAMEIRTYERGVEAETLACGTGVLAAVAAAVAEGRAAPPVTALTRGGFELEVTATVEDRFIRSWTLTGDARCVAEGELLPGAAGLPAPPSW